MSMMNPEELQNLQIANAVNGTDGINARIDAGVNKQQQQATAQFNKVAATNPFIVGADAKNMENGESSLFDDAANATIATGANVLTSFWNTGVALANSVGGDFQETSTDQFLRSQGLNDSATFYQNHKAGIDAAGLVVGSLIPGAAGIKALKLAQAAAATSDIRFISGLGKLATASDDIKTAVSSIASGAQKEVWTAQSAKLIARAGAQGALEGVAGSWAMLATMNQAPTLNEDNLGYFDSLTKNFTTETMMGAGFGAVLGSGIGALSYKGLARRALNAVRGDEATLLEGIKAPNSFVAKTDSGQQVVSLTSGDKIGYHALDLQSTQAKIDDLTSQNQLGTISDKDKNITLPTLQQRLLSVNNELRKQLSALSTDPKVQQYLQDTFASDPTAAVNARSTFSGAVSVTPAMKGIGTFRPSSIDLNQAVNETGGMPAVIGVGDYNPLDILYGNDDFLKFAHQQSANFNNLAATGGDGFLTDLISSDFKTFGNTSNTGPIRLRRAVASMEQASRELNPSRWAIIDNFQKEYGGITSDTLQSMDDAAKDRFRMKMQAAMQARDLSGIFSDVHDALSTPGVGETVAKNYPQMVEYLNKNQLTSRYLKNNYAILDSANGTVYHQNVLPTAADFGTPTLQKTATSQNVAFGPYSVEVKPGLFSLDGMSKFPSASAGRLGTAETAAVLKGMDEYAVKTQAQYVGAQLDNKFIQGVEKEDGKTIIGANDLPYLDSALSSKANKFYVEGQPELDREGLTNYVRNLKANKIQEALNANQSFNSSWSSEHLSRIFNTDNNFVELGANSGRNDIGVSSIQNLANGNPRFLKIKYATDFDKTQPDVDARWQTITTANKTAAQQSSLDVLSRLDPVLAQNLADVNEMMPSVKTLATEQGTSYFGAANGAFNSYESRAQQIGQMVNTAHHKIAQSIQSTMLPLTQTLLKDDLAKAEIGVVVQKARSARYVAADGLSDVINQLTPYINKVDDPEILKDFMGQLQKIDQSAKNAAAKGSNGTFISAEPVQLLNNLRDNLMTVDPSELSVSRLNRLIKGTTSKLLDAPLDSFGIKSEKVAGYLKGHMDINKNFVGMRTQINNAVGKITRWNPDELYFGPPDIKGKSIAFVESPATPSGERARHMVIADTPEQRNAQMEIIKNQFPDYKVLSDPQLSDFKEALAQWEGGNWASTPEFSADLARRGVANNFFPRTDGQDAVTAVNDTIKRHTQLIRDSVQTRFAEDFASLKGMEENWDTMYGKRTGKNNFYMQDNPARKIRQLALDLPQDNSKAVSYINSFVNNIADKTGRALENAFGGGRKWTMDDVNRINGIMQDAGIKPAYTTAAELALANTQAPSNLIRQFTATANAFVSLGMHRLETMMSLVNAVGNTVLSVPLLSTLIRNLPDDVRMQNFGVSTGVGTELSIPKFMAQSLKEVMTDYKGLTERYSSMGIPVSHSRVYSQMMDTLVTEGDLSAGGIAYTLTKKMNDMGDFVGKYNGANVIIGFNRLLNAHMGERLADLYGATDGLSKSSFINTFLNKVEGTMVSSQRPKFFQGIIGQAMGLFQSYNLHLMQQLTGNILDGNTRAAIEALAMNGTLFGAQSMPGWQQLNNVVANHNKNGFGVDTYVNDAVGHDIGNWLTYGSLSNILHMGVFTRGKISFGPDMYGSVADMIPAVSILQNTFAGIGNTVSQMRNNGLTTNGLLEGLNTMGWNRPIAELAQRALGYTPSKYGDIISYNNQSNNAFSNAWSIFGAALGAKDLDAAIANTQYYESKQRKAIIQDRLNDLGASVKAATHNNGNLSQAQVENFAHKYVQSGGDMKNFQRWIISTSLSGQASKVETLRKGLTSASGRQAQALMGGAAPDLFGPDDSEVF